MPRAVKVLDGWVNADYITEVAASPVFGTPGGWGVYVGVRGSYSQRLVRSTKDDGGVEASMTREDAELMANYMRLDLGWSEVSPRITPAPF